MVLVAAKVIVVGERRGTHLVVARSCAASKDSACDLPSRLSSATMHLEVKRAGVLEAERRSRRASSAGRRRWVRRWWTKVPSMRTL